MRPMGLNLIRTLTATVVMTGLLLAGLPDAGSSQEQPPDVPRGKLKHDKIVPPGPPCALPDRPCPPGLGGEVPPGLDATGRYDGEFPPGAASSPAVASGLILTPGFEPTPAFTEAVASLREGRFLMPTPVPGEAQRAVFDLFADRGDPNGTALVAALTSRGNEGARDECVRLVRSVRALTVVDGQLPAAVEAFNALVDASSDAFLADPAPEFLAVHAFLGTLTGEAMAGKPGAR